MSDDLDPVEHLRAFADQRKIHLYRSDVERIAAEFEATLDRLAEERDLVDRLAMLLVKSQVCEAPLSWVMERVDLLDEWAQRRR